MGNWPFLGVYTTTQKQHRKTWTYIYALSRFRARDPNVRQAQYRIRPWLRGHFNWQRRT